MKTMRQMREKPHRASSAGKANDKVKSSRDGEKNKANENRFFCVAALTLSPYQFELSRYFAQEANGPPRLTKNNPFSVSGFTFFATAAP